MRAEDLWEELMRYGTITVPATNRVRPIIGKLRRIARRKGYTIYIGYDGIAGEYVITVAATPFRLPELDIGGVGLF